MRVWLTGATGFVGSNLARVLIEQHGHELVCPVHRTPPPAGAPYEAPVVDLTDAAAVRTSILDSRPDAVVHSAILNSLTALTDDRPAAWAAYVDATRNVVRAANEANAHVVLISTDWVFDGTQGPAAEDAVPNPVNFYGALKAASELVLTLEADRGTVARIAGVQGVHWARPRTARMQDIGFGYLVASLVDELRAGHRFGVWDGDGLNLVATPTLASDAGEMVARVLEREVTGILHLCGREPVHRVALARRALEVFELDAGLLDVVAPPSDALAVRPAATPVDSSLSSDHTARLLGLAMPGVDEMLRRLRYSMDTGELARMEALV